MNTVNLSQIDIYVLSTANDKGRERVERLEASLQKLGWKVPKIVYGPIETKGCEKGTVRLIREALLRETWSPFILLEDDCAFSQNQITTINYKEGTDAIWVGISEFSYLNRRELSNIKHLCEDKECNQEPNHIHRLYNMTSTHGILFLSKKFSLTVMNLAIEGYVINREYDLLIASVMSQYKVYCLCYPLVYQDNFNEKHTNIKAYNYPQVTNDYVHPLMGEVLSLSALSIKG